MSEKSYVSLEQRVCLVCGATYETNSLLLDRRLKNSLEHHTVTGYGLCPEHEKMNDDGYLALIECANDSKRERLEAHEANRTGRVAHIRREVAKRLFNVPVEDIEDNPVMYVQAGINGEKGVIDLLRDMQQE